jgi:hypothetical protein
MPASISGTGATLTFGGSAFVANIISIGGLEITREALDDTTLATSGDFMTKVQAELGELSEIEVSYYFDDESGVPDETAAAASIVLTFPQGDLFSAANLTGTGFATSVKYPDLENNTLMVGTAKLQFDGKTGPTWTDGVLTDPGP